MYISRIIHVAKKLRNLPPTPTCGGDKNSFV